MALDKAPYFAALVASSWTNNAIVVANFGEKNDRSRNRYSGDFVGAKFGYEDLPQTRPLSLRLQDKIVGGRQRREPTYDSLSRLRIIAELETYDGLDCRDFIFQSVRKLFYSQLAKVFFVFKSLRKASIVVVPAHTMSKQATK